MSILRRSRTILALNGIIMIFIGIIFFIYPENLKIIMFPNIVSNPEALETGIVLRYLMGAGHLTIGIILYLARISIKSGAQRLLLGSGIGFMIIFFTAVVHTSLSSADSIDTLTIDSVASDSFTTLTL